MDEETKTDITIPIDTSAPPVEQAAEAIYAALKREGFIVIQPILRGDGLSKQGLAAINSALQKITTLKFEEMSAEFRRDVIVKYGEKIGYDPKMIETRIMESGSKFRIRNLLK